MRRLAMVVDDNARLVRGLAASLRWKGFEVSAFTCCQDGVKFVSELKQAPEVALVDFVLDGGRTGLEVLAALRGHFDEHVPALLMSGYSNESIGPREVTAALVEKPLPADLLDCFLAAAAAVSQMRKRSPLRQSVAEFVASFGLTAVEARIVGRLAAGARRSELAGQLELGEDTLKHQLKRLLRKTNAVSTDDLVARLLRWSQEEQGPASPVSGKSALSAQLLHAVIGDTPASETDQDGFRLSALALRNGRMSLPE